MAKRTIITTEAQEEVLSWLVRTLNAEKGTSITVDELLQAEFPNFLRPFEVRFREAETAAVARQFKLTQDPAVRAVVKDALGVEL